MSRCLAFGYILSPVTLRSIRTLQKSVHNMDDKDKEPVSNLCGHCGAFVFAHEKIVKVIKEAEFER